MNLSVIMIFAVEDTDEGGRAAKLRHLLCQLMKRRGRIGRANADRMNRDHFFFSLRQKSFCLLDDAITINPG
ncbi:MAG: hypothetical protein FWC58_06400 [Desulfobulbus sp.]|nr:hypothetical protein [Desulfobulbus sp.]